MPTLEPNNTREIFAAAVAAKVPNSEEWWNGVAAAVNGISLQMDFEWLEGKFCPLQGFYDDNSQPGTRTSVLHNQLMPYLRDENPLAADKLEMLLDVFYKYAGSQGVPSDYDADFSRANKNLSALISEVPQLQERQLNDVNQWMKDQLPKFPTKTGFEFNV